VNLDRSNLLAQMAHGSPCVLLCAPSGYGKTHLLKEFHAEYPGALYVQAQPGMNRLELERRIASRPSTPTTILIDDAHHLKAEVISGLVAKASKIQPLILALRHSSYPKVQLLKQRGLLAVLGTDALAFSEAESISLYGSAGLEWHRKTLGWPYVTQLIGEPPANLQAYLQDLLDELPNRLHSLLIDAVSVENAGTELDRVLGKDRLREIMDHGFPIISRGPSLEIHSLMLEYLTQTLGGHSSDSVRKSSVEVAFHADLFEKMSTAERLELINRCFDKDEEDETNLDDKLHLLASVSPNALSPKSRNAFAHLLNVAGRGSEAIHVLELQVSLGAATTHTHVLLARIASETNDFFAFREHLDIAESLIADAHDRARFYQAQSFYFVRLNKYPEAVAHAKTAYQSALHCTSVGLHITTLLHIAYVEQLASNLPGAILAAKQVLTLAEGYGDRFSRRVAQILSNLADMLKDAGDHETALTLIQRGLHLTITPHRGFSPYLYTTRGLIYMELGDFEAAIESFETAISAFEAASWLAGLLLPHTYLAYAAYRLGQRARLEQAVLDLNDVIARTSTRADEYAEYKFYQPLAVGLYHLAHAEETKALEALQSIQTEGGLSYDSVLLAILTEGSILVRQGRLDREYAERFYRLLEGRNTPGDATLIMYRDFYQDVLQASQQAGVAYERFERVLLALKKSPVQRTRTRLEVISLGGLGLRVNGKTIKTKSKYPIQALIYLIMNRGWVTSRELGDQLFYVNADDEIQMRRQRASTALNQLRSLLNELDSEVAESILESSPQYGYRFVDSDLVTVELDVMIYLSDKYHPESGDDEQLIHLLEHIQPFQAGGTGSFNDRINGELAERTEAVARYLAEVALKRSDLLGAASLLLHGLRITQTPEFEAMLRDLVSALPAAAADHILRLVNAFSDDDDTNHLFVAAFKACSIAAS
jgi:tetratricopeptide (TPR) repeat protein